MTSSDTNNARPRGSWIRILLFPFALLLLTAIPARAQSVGGCVANFGGVIDGFLNPVLPSQINIDGNCTIRNFPASNPLTSNISFVGTLRGVLVIFDNVVFTGNMSCDSVHENKLWFVNGSSSTLKQSCQNLLIPVEKIEKANPPGPPFVTVGVPFTWKLTIPVLFDPATATVVDLTYVSHTITWLDDGTPVPHTFTNVGNVLTFDNIPIVTAGRQFIINLTVVLNNTPVNAPGKQFINTAKWDFGRLIGGVFYQPLPGESGVTPPLTIAAPVLVVT